jgi:hypothetical protein
MTYPSFSLINDLLDEFESREHKAFLKACAFGAKMNDVLPEWQNIQKQVCAAKNHLREATTSWARENLNDNKELQKFWLEE